MINAYKLSAPIFFVLSFFTLCQSQSNDFGLLWEDATYQDIPKINPDSLRSGRLPGLFSLRNYCPTPGDQKSYATCVGWALAHALTIQRAVQKNEKNIVNVNKMLHSAYYIYNQINLGSCQSGAFFSKGFNLLKVKGACLATEFNSSSLNCSVLPQDAQHRSAANFTIKEYKRLFEKNDSHYDKLQLIKQLLLENRPVIIGMGVPDDFRYRHPKDLDWSKAKEANAHAMVVVGYNNDLEVFEVMNSYGANWGENGFFFINEIVLSKLVLYGYSMRL